MNFDQNVILDVPDLVATTMASIKKANVSVMIVPPMADVIDPFFASPNLLTIGNVISVWEENILAKRTEATRGISNMKKAPNVPKISGIKKVKKPNKRL